MATNKAKALVSAKKAAAAAAPAAAPRERKSLNPQAMIAGFDPGRAPTESGETVTVTIPKAFTLTLDDHTQVKYEAGIGEMPVEHAEHWWSKQMGVEIYTKRK
jgi:hypothetical protein